jgi:hypothetical protein
MLGVLVSMMMFACKKDSSVGSSMPPVIEYVRLVDSTKRDSTFTTSLTGTWIVIHGQHFAGIRNVYFNDVPVPFNVSLATDNDVISSLRVLISLVCRK